MEFDNTDLKSKILNSYLEFENLKNSGNFAIENFRSFFIKIDSDNISKKKLEDIYEVLRFNIKKIKAKKKEADKKKVPILYNLKKINNFDSLNVSYYYTNIHSDINLQKDFMHLLLFKTNYIIAEFIEIYRDIEIENEDPIKKARKDVLKDISEYIFWALICDNEKIKNDIDSNTSLDVIKAMDKNDFSKLANKVMNEIQNIQLGVADHNAIIFFVLDAILTNNKIYETVKSVSHQKKFEKLFDFIKMIFKQRNNISLIPIEFNFETAEGRIKIHMFLNSIWRCYHYGDYSSVLFAKS